MTGLRSTHESELTAGVEIVPGKRYGFFTDTTLCIGCKACEVACKTWNNLPADGIGLSGMSYDNTRELSSNTWRHVKFVERIAPPPAQGEGGFKGKEVSEENLGFPLRRSPSEGSRREPQPFQSQWLMMSDVCKHCANAPCLEACPTGAIFRTEFDTVVVQNDICNGCGYCVPACPFGVVDLSLDDGKAHKCTLCYDRMKGGFEPACAKSCPTDSIQFGPLDELDERARKRVDELHERGVEDAYLYGAPGTPGATGGLERLNAFFLLTAPPETYNLPLAPTRASNRSAPSFKRGLATVLGLALAAVAVFAGGRS